MIKKFEVLTMGAGKANFWRGTLASDFFDDKLNSVFELTERQCRLLGPAGWSMLQMFFD